MYCMYKITGEKTPSFFEIDGYIEFYAEERPQERFQCQTPREVRRAALSTDALAQYPIPKNKRVQKYKAKWCA